MKATNLRIFREKYTKKQSLLFLLLLLSFFFVILQSQLKNYAYDILPEC